MKNKEIYLSFSYVNEEQVEFISNELVESKVHNLGSIISNSAGIDIGLNNLISLFIDDGARYKYYNSKFNRFIAKLNNSISDEVIEYKTITKKDKIEVQIPRKWTKRG